MSSNKTKDLGHHLTHPSAVVVPDEVIIWGMCRLGHCNDHLRCRVRFDHDLNRTNDNNDVRVVSVPSDFFCVIDSKNAWYRRFSVPYTEPRVLYCEDVKVNIPIYPYYNPLLCLASSSKGFYVVEAGLPDPGMLLIGTCSWADIDKGSKLEIMKVQLPKEYNINYNSRHPYIDATYLAMKDEREQEYDHLLVAAHPQDKTYPVIIEMSLDLMNEKVSFTPLTSAGKLLELHVGPDARAYAVCYKNGLDLWVRGDHGVWCSLGDPTQGEVSGNLVSCNTLFIPHKKQSQHFDRMFLIQEENRLDKLITSRREYGMPIKQNFLGSGEFLLVGNYIQSQNGKYFGIMKGNGTFCVHKGAGPGNELRHLWASPTAGDEGRPYFAFMRSDGTFCVCEGMNPPVGSVLWCTETGGDETTIDPIAVLQDDGNFCISNIKRDHQRILWCSETKAVEQDRDQIGNSLDKIKEWFPEEAEYLNTNRELIIEHIYNYSDPDDDSPLNSVGHIKSVEYQDQELLSFTDCQKKCGIVVIDIILFILSIAGLRVKYNEKMGREILRELGPDTLRGFWGGIRNFKKAVGNYNKARALFPIVGGIYSAGGFRLVLKYAKDNLTRWEWVKTGAIATAQLTAWFASDGVAFVAEVMLTIMNAEKLIEDTIIADNTCN